ncbi:unnamed protein product, partial [Porites evermanni]
KGRTELGDVTPHNIKQLKKLNSVVFPVSYNDKSLCRYIIPVKCQRVFSMIRVETIENYSLSRILDSDWPS